MPNFLGYYDMNQFSTIPDTQEFVLFWFRRDLRLFDNHGLSVATRHGLPVIPVFIFDPDILDELPETDRRLSFIHLNLERLHAQLQQTGSGLHVYHDKPVNALLRICETYRIRAVYLNHDYEPYAVSRDEHIKQKLEIKGIKVFTFKDQVIFEKSDVLKQDGSPYTVFTPYSKIWKSRLRETHVSEFPVDLNQFAQIRTPGVPRLQELGFIPMELSVPDAALPAQRIFQYGSSRDIPALDATSRMSVHLRFGTISIRQLVKMAVENNETYLNELIWREFFMSILFHFPQVVTQSFKPAYDRIQWKNEETLIQAWKEGRTGIPIVDAGMRELRTTGLMHNRVRMITASFLTKHCLVDWRIGEAWFASQLLDFELSSNNGNWQWAAGCGCDAAPYFRVFNPILQQEKFDPEFRYVKTWVPEFRSSAYPPPILDLREAKEQCIRAFKKALTES